MPEAKAIETPEAEYARLFDVLEQHRIKQNEIRSEQEQYDRMVNETRNQMKLGVGGEVVNKLIQAAFQQVPRPEIPAELPESKRFHELHGILAQKAAKP